MKHVYVIYTCVRFTSINKQRRQSKPCTRIGVYDKELELRFNVDGTVVNQEL
jgi:hypothetical protein